MNDPESLTKLKGVMNQTILDLVMGCAQRNMGMTCVEINVKMADDTHKVYAVVALDDVADIVKTLMDNLADEELDQEDQ